ncbi:hypothetical protein BGX21_007222 [Mortierella sp. AD011]|nr:hypothetical protein BGX20_005202 [Mortierella sp. AD010]KAF9403064.1 hypothetical protein BGX21_007222 [Mortierella sp. AD011]
MAITFNIRFAVIGEPETTQPFLEGVDPIMDTDKLKGAIYDLKKSTIFKNVEDSSSLVLYRVSLPSGSYTSDRVFSEDDTMPQRVMTGPVSNHFNDDAEKDEIHIIVRRPKGSQTQSDPGVSDALTPSASITPEELNSRFNSIEDEFYSEDWSEFIEAYISDNVKLPVTDGKIPGLPIAWRRVGKDRRASTHRPSLLFFDLPDLDGSYMNPDSNSKAREILARISEKNYSSYPIFGASGCGKTRTVMDMLGLNWGFYFNGSKDDRGSDDVKELVSLVETRLGDNLLINNRITKSITACLLLARVSILSRCLTVSNGRMTPSKWMLLQVCSQVLGEVHWKDSRPSRTDLFLSLFERMANSLGKFDFLSLNKLLRARFDILTKVLPGWLPNDSKFLLILDEAQSLGEALPDQFRSEQDNLNIKRPILSPFFHGLEELSEVPSQICTIPCGTGFCVYDLAWVGVAGKASKAFREVLDDPRFKRAGSFPRWDDQAKVKAYFRTIDLYLEKQGHPTSALKLKDLINDQVCEMLYAWFRGRLRPMISVIEDVIQYGDAGQWRKSIMQLMSALTNPTIEESGNLCYELSRILKQILKDGDSGLKTNADIRENLRRAVKNKLLFGKDYKLECSEPILVQASFARIVDDLGKEVTIIDEPIAFEAAVNYFQKDDPGLIQLLGNGLSDAPTPGSMGTYMEYFSPALLVPAFHEKPLVPSLFKVKANGNKTPEALSTKRFSIVGCNIGLRGTRHEFITMSDFLDAHCNRGSVFKSELVSPFFFPKENPSGPDLVFVLESGGQYYPVFMQSKISGHLKDIKEAHETTCYDCIKAHLESSSLLANFCSENIFLSLLFMPYHVQGRYSVAKDNVITINKTTKLDQYTMIIDKNNRGDLFTKGLLEFLEKVKEPFERYVFTTQDVKDEGELDMASGSNKGKMPKKTSNMTQAMEDIGESDQLSRPNKRKTVESEVKGNDEEISSGSKKRIRRVPKSVTTTQVVKGSMIIKPIGLEKRRMSERLANAAQVKENDGEMSKPRRSNKRRAVEPIQASEEVKPNGPGQKKKSKKSEETD